MSNNMKGIILAGGSEKCLYLVTQTFLKQTIAIWYQ